MAESAGRVRLRVTAEEAHIDLVCEAEATLRALAAETADIAFQLDRAEIDPEAARTLLSVSASRLEDLLERLRAVPGAAENAITADLSPWWNNFAHPFLCFRAKIQKAPFPFPQK